MLPSLAPGAEGLVVVPLTVIVTPEQVVPPPPPLLHELITVTEVKNKTIKKVRVNHFFISYCVFILKIAELNNDVLLVNVKNQHCDLIINFFERLNRKFNAHRKNYYGAVEPDLFVNLL